MLSNVAQIQVFVGCDVVAVADANNIMVFFANIYDTNIARKRDNKIRRETTVASHRSIAGVTGAICDSEVLRPDLTRKASLLPLASGISPGCRRSSRPSIASITYFGETGRKCNENFPSQRGTCQLSNPLLAQLRLLVSGGRSLSEQPDSKGCAAR